MKDQLIFERVRKGVILKDDLLQWKAGYRSNALYYEGESIVKRMNCNVYRLKKGKKRNSQNRINIIVSNASPALLIMCANLNLCTRLFQNHVHSILAAMTTLNGSPKKSINGKVESEQRFIR